MSKHSIVAYRRRLQAEAQRAVRREMGLAECRPTPSYVGRHRKDYPVVVLAQASQ